MPIRRFGAGILVRLARLDRGGVGFTCQTTSSEVIGMGSEGFEPSTIGLKVQ
jgi:hypothetical protein